MIDASVPWTQRAAPGVNAGVTITRAKMSAPEVETAHAAASRYAKDMATWSGYRISPDAALLPELETINARVDDLTRNNGIAAGAERTFVDNVIGPRISCKPNPDRVALGKDADWVAKWSPKVESLWSSFADTDWFDAGLRYNLHVSTRLQARMIAATGECLALPLWTQRNGSKWNTCVRLVDPARLSNPNGKFDTPTLRGGIEIDPDTTAATAYHIRKAHPGDTFGLGRIGGEWERIPAYQTWGRRRVLHVYESERVGQTRGKAVIASVARQFRMLDKMNTEQLRLAVLNSLVFAALETPLDQESIVELMGGVEDAAGKPVNPFHTYQSLISDWRVKMEGGAIIPMPPGTSMKPFAPQQQMSNLESFTSVMLKNIGAGLNMPYELVFRDFSKSNYSSARAALLEAWRYFLSVRQFIIDHWLSAVFDLWFEEAVNRGMIPDCTPDDYYANQIAWTRCNWIFSGRGWVDPQREAGAAQIRMAIGVTTLADECGEQGKDWRAQMEQQSRENAYADSLKNIPRPHTPEARVIAAQIAADAKTGDAGDEPIANQAEKLTMRYPQIAARVFNTPLLIAPKKLDAILAFLGPRMGLEVGGMPASRLWYEEDEPSGPSEARGLYQVTERKTAIIPVHGALVQRGSIMTDVSGMTSYSSLSAAIGMALADKDVQRIVLDIDSPGGEAAGAFDFADEIYAARGAGKPIMAVVNELACSAAYLIASATSRIYSARTGYSGSIGVMSSRLDISKANATAGVVVTLIYAGEEKAYGYPTEPMSAAEKDDITESVERLYGLFVGSVARNRGLDEQVIRDTKAGVFDGTAALQLGLVDEVMSFKQALVQIEGGFIPAAVVVAEPKPVMSLPKRGTQLLKARSSRRT